MRFEAGVAARSRPEPSKVVAPCANGNSRAARKRWTTPPPTPHRGPVTRDSPYSIDQNLWGASIECGEWKTLAGAAARHATS